MYDDGWMADHGFLRAAGGSGDTIEAVLAHKVRGSGGLPPLVHVHPSDTVRAAIAILQEYGVSQMPVVKGEPPLSLGRGGRDRHRPGPPRAAGGRSVGRRHPVEAIMGPPLPMIGSGEPVDLAAARLADGAAVLVIDAGHPTGIVTRSDLLEFLSGRAGS